MHCGDQKHLGLCLGYVPALAYGSCRVSDQGTTLRASDLHNARATILNPFTKDPVAACLLSMRLTVARVKPTRAAIAPCLMPSQASANTSCLIPIGVGRGIVRTIRKTFEKICKYWFKVVTVWRLIWGNDHLYCGFGARRSHLTLHWMSAKGSVGFRWGTITGPYHANFSQVETQKFDPHWFYCLQWGCNNLFCQECI